MFFDEVEDFECPECGAPRSAFYDANDKDDPHNQKVLYTVVCSVVWYQVWYGMGWDCMGWYCFVLFCMVLLCGVVWCGIV